MNLASNYAYKWEYFSAENALHPIPSAELKHKFGINLCILHILYDLHAPLHSMTIQLIQHACLSFPRGQYKSINHKIWILNKSYGVDTEVFFIEANGSTMTSPGPEFGPM